MHDHTLSLGKEVKARRKALGLSQVELGELAGVSTRFVHELEHEKPSVHFSKVVDVLDALGLELLVRVRSRSQ